LTKKLKWDTEIAVGCVHKNVWHGAGSQNVRNGVGHQESASGAESVSFGAEFLGVAELAVDVTIWPVTGQHRVQYALALFAVEASLVPNLPPKSNQNLKLKN
jgi:hypothetical protein